MAEGYEQRGNLARAAVVLEHVVKINATYGLPKLEVNRKRLERLRVRLQSAPDT